MDKEKPTRTLIERKIKALEQYLGIVFELDDDPNSPYDDYHEKDYGLGADVKKLKEKVLPNKKKSFWN